MHLIEDDCSKIEISLFDDILTHEILNYILLIIDSVLSDKKTKISTSCIYTFNIFNNLKDTIIKKVSGARLRTSKDNNELLITYHYNYASNNNQAQLNFRNVIEEECRANGFNWLEQKEFQLKFIARVNENRKSYEENEKFRRLLRSEIKIKDKNVGVLVSANYPNIKIKLTSLLTNEDLQNITEIVPDLTGELEKDARLEDTITKLESDGKSLANPNIKEFIFDSTKAKQLKDADILNPESKEWQEIKEHQNPKSYLNDSQIKGVLSSLYAEDLVVIQGPPGTGKSTAISEIIWHHIRTNPKQRILLTSESHLAVDNALDKLGTIPNGLVKPVRFGVEEDVFDETENQEESKIENEGKRYSYKRFKMWLDSQQESTPPEKYKVLSDNAVQKWANQIADKSTLNIENHINISPFLQDWKDLLANPNQEIKQLFYNNYMQYVNIVGATSSSISEVSFTKKDDFGNPRKGRFLREFENVFGKSNREKRDNSPKVKFDVIITDEASKATPPELYSVARGLRK